MCSFIYLRLLVCQSNLLLDLSLRFGHSCKQQLARQCYPCACLVNWLIAGCQLMVRLVVSRNSARKLSSVWLMMEHLVVWKRMTSSGLTLSQLMLII